MKNFKYNKYFEYNEKKYLRCACCKYCNTTTDRCNLFDVCVVPEREGCPPAHIKNAERLHQTEQMEPGNKIVDNGGSRKMKNFYVAVAVSENGKYFAYVVKASESDNLLSKLNIKDVLHANICSSKKRAAELVEAWNASYKTNGTHLYA